MCINLFLNTRQTILAGFKTISILLRKFIYNSLLYLVNKNPKMHFPKQKFLNVQPDYMMPVQMLLISIIFFNLQTRKKC